MLSATAAFSPVPADNAMNVPFDIQLCWNTTGEIAKLIYGFDDRKEYCEVGPELRAAADSTVALVDTTTTLINNGNGTYSLPGTPVLRDYIEWLTRPFYYPPCPGERFLDQPIPVSCSGVLVAPDLIVTAGHCIVTASDCANMAFVFGFHEVGTPLSCSPVLTFPQADVYFCSAIVGRAQVNGGPDWGVIRLDRAVTGHVPLPIRRIGKVPDAQPLTLIGHPVGLPTKIADGAATIVRDNTPLHHFLANVDAYEGNSGSAVLNATTGFPMIEGLLVWGNDDWVYNAANQCTESNRCPDTGCTGTPSRWEGVTRATEFASLVPYYDVYFGPCGSMNLVHSGPEACWSPPFLQGGTEYCWQVVAKNNCGESPGQIWSFTTGHCIIDAAIPPNCAIDARQPYPPNTPGSPQGWNSVALTFGLGCSVSGVTPGDFTVSCNPAGQPCPTITGVTPVGQTVTVQLSGVIPAGKWTCITHTASGERVCIGSLPADVNSDRTAAPVDILDLIDCLNGVRTCQMWQCDIDRSNLCAPADILSEIDLLNCASGFLCWNGRNLPVCPSAP